MAQKDSKTDWESIGVVALTALAVAVVLFAFGSLFAGVWLNDGRWLATGMIILLPCVIAFLAAGP